MGDLISREAAVQMLREKAQSYATIMFARSQHRVLAQEVAMDCAFELSKMEAVDAEPVRRSRWHYHGDGYYFCDECKKYIVCIGGDADLNYCPNCGLPMDEED